MNGVRFTIMNENDKKILWRCSLMSTKTRKCPARVTMYKGVTPNFVVNQCQHSHMELVRGNYKAADTSRTAIERVRPQFYN